MRWPFFKTRGDKMEEARFCDVVLAEWTSQYGGEPQSFLREPRTCVLEIDEVTISFFYDYRDGRVSSNILFVKDEVAKTDPLYANIIYKLIMLDEGNATEEASWGPQDSVKDEVNRVTKILSSVRQGKYCPRDLSYFYWGFNAAYSESLNRASAKS